MVTIVHGREFEKLRRFGVLQYALRIWDVSVTVLVTDAVLLNPVTDPVARHQETLLRLFAATRRDQSEDKT